MSSKDIVVRFGRKLQRVRTAKGVTQMVLADRIGTDQSTISLIENGKQEPGLRFIDMLATALKVPLSELFKDL